MRALSKACLVVAVLGGCSVSVPTLLPPPFGPSDPPDAPRLFFPTGLAAAPSGWLLVNNGNFDRGFDSGAMLSISPDFIAQQYAGDPAVVMTTAALPAEADPKHPLRAVMLASFAGPIAFDQSGTVAYTASRASNTVTAVQLDPATGELSCAVRGGKDCRTGLVNLLTTAALEGPYGVAAGFARLPGDTADHPVMFVSSLVPHIESITNTQLSAFGRVAALQTDAVGQLLYTLVASSPTIANQIGAGPILFDGSRRQLILGGCYQRFGASSSGDPTTAKCTLQSGVNPLRFVNVDSGVNANVRVFDLAPAVRGNETTGLALGGEDASGVPQVLYAVSRNPDVMVELLLPPLQGQDPIIRRVTTLPLSPSGALRLRRPAGQSGPDLIAVAGSNNSTISIYDSFQGQVVALLPASVVPGVTGDYPFALAQLDSSPDQARARFAVTIFGSCQLAFYDVSFATPTDARLRSVVGACP